MQRQNQNNEYFENLNLLEHIKNLPEDIKPTITTTLIKNLVQKLFYNFYSSKLDPITLTFDTTQKSFMPFIGTFEHLEIHESLNSKKNNNVFFDKTVQFKHDLMLRCDTNMLSIFQLKKNIPAKISQIEFVEITQFKHSLKYPAHPLWSPSGNKILLYDFWSGDYIIIDKNCSLLHEGKLVNPPTSGTYNYMWSKDDLSLICYDNPQIFHEFDLNTQSQKKIFDLESLDNYPTLKKYPELKDLKINIELWPVDRNYIQINDYEKGFAYLININSLAVQKTALPPCYDENTCVIFFQKNSFFCIKDKKLMIWNPLFGFIPIHQNHIKKISLYPGKGVNSIKLLESDLGSIKLFESDDGNYRININPLSVMLTYFENMIKNHKDKKNENSFFLAQAIVLTMLQEAKEKNEKISLVDKHTKQHIAFLFNRLPEYIKNQFKKTVILYEKQ